jgi:hypothetical protein
VPLVKLTIRAEPVEVDDRELEVLRGQGLLEHVLDESSPESGPGPAAPSPKPAPAKAGSENPES